MGSPTPQEPHHPAGARGSSGPGKLSVWEAAGAWTALEGFDSVSALGLHPCVPPGPPPATGVLRRGPLWGCSPRPPLPWGWTV